MDAFILQKISKQLLHNNRDGMQHTMTWTTLGVENGFSNSFLDLLAAVWLVTVGLSYAYVAMLRAEIIRPPWLVTLALACISCCCLGTMLRFGVLTLTALALASGAVALTTTGTCENVLFAPPPYLGQALVGSTVNTPPFDNRCGLDSTNGTYFVQITPTANVPMNITTCGPDTTFNTVVALYRGDSCDTLQCVETNDNAPCSEHGRSAIDFTPDGSTVRASCSFIAVDHIIQLTWSCSGGLTPHCYSTQPPPQTCAPHCFVAAPFLS